MSIRRNAMSNSGYSNALADKVSGGSNPPIPEEVREKENAKIIPTDETAYVNCTPHSLTFDLRGLELEIPAPSDDEEVPRVEETTNKFGGTPHFKKVSLKEGDVKNLPDRQRNTVFIVSGRVRDAAPHRQDLASPTNFVRDEDGRIQAAQAIAFRK